MTDVVRIMNNIDGSKALLFECPGCSMLHAPHVVGGTSSEPVWEWNGSLSAPTISPSLLVRWTMRPPGQPETNHVCHSFLRDGVMEFLGDCTHEHAGRRLPLAIITEENEP